MKKAKYIYPPEMIEQNTAQITYIGQDVFRQENGELWMFNSCGRAQADFSYASFRGLDIPDILISRDGGKSFSPSDIKIPYNLDGMADASRSVIRLADGRICVVAHRAAEVFKQCGNTGTPAITFSGDNGQTWEPYRKMMDEEQMCFIMNQRLLQLSTGRLVAAVSREYAGTTAETFREGSSPNASGCYYSDDLGQTWKEGEMVPYDNPRGLDEGAVAEIGENKLVMLSRSGVGCHLACFSEDGGEHWTKPEKTSLIASCSALTLTHLPDGRLIVAYCHCAPETEDTYFPRTPLCYAISDDGGHTWSEPVVIDDSHATLGYPSITATDKGILFIYTKGKYKDNFKFDPDDLKESGLVRCLVEYPD